MGRLCLVCLTLILSLVPTMASGTFVEVTYEAFGILPGDMPGWSSVHWPDYDGDGWPDLHISGDVLFRNNGDGTFTRVTGVGLDVEHTSAYRASWADADNDGDLDCIQSSYGATSAETVHKAYYFESSGPPDFTFDRTTYHECPLNTRTGNPLFVDGDNDAYYEIYQATFGNWAPDYGRTHDRYFEADGGETWTDVTATHIPQLMTTYYERHTRGIVACDWTEDYFSDIGIFVTVYGVDWVDPSWENMLWANDAAGNFVDVAAEWGVAVEPHGQYGVGLASGASWGDYDNDGDFDLVVANIHGWTALYRNNGQGGNFTNVTEEAGLYTNSNQEWHNTAWVDLDNDGDLDLIATAWYDRVAFLYENEGPENLGHFHLATADFGFNPIGNFMGIDGGVGAADYDRDGDMDLFYEGGVGGDDGKHLFRNDSDPAHHWLVVQLQGSGTSCALTAAGAKIRLGLPSGWSGVKQVENGSADACQHMHAVHFGLGETDQIQWVEVTWPNPSLTEVEVWSWEDIGESVDQWITLAQGSGSPGTAVDLPAGPAGLSIDGLYPNPTSEQVTCLLKSRGSGTAQVALYDVSGRKVTEETLRVAGPGPSPLRLSVRQLPAGVYLLRARQGDATASAKLFVLR